MNFRLVDAGWDKEFRSALFVDAASTLQIICPFIKVGALKHLLDGRRPRSIHAITRFNLIEFAEGVSDIAALRALLDAGAQVRGVRNLHAKLYLFGSSRAILTSANLTDAALSRNHELGFVSESTSIVALCRAYFDDLWARSGIDLTVEQLEAWDEAVTRYLATGARSGRPTDLDDYGADAGVPPAPPIIRSPLVADARQGFVKFLGTSSDRVPLSFPTIKEVEAAGCHWAVCYPAKGRPAGVQDGAVIYISRLTRSPNDIRVFGRATGLRHLPGRDDATPEDIARRPWKQTWPRYIRVHHAEFVAGTMVNGVSLNALMEALGPDSFGPTQRNAARSQGNTDPRRAYRQKPAVELTGQGLAWLDDQLEVAFAAHGNVPADDLTKLDWPEIP
jgi:hypothetical protein